MFRRGRDRGEPGDLAVGAADPQRERVVRADRDRVVVSVEQAPRVGDGVVVVGLLGVVRALGRRERVAHERVELIAAFVGEGSVLHTRSAPGSEINLPGACEAVAVEPA